ncbi:hypothetical protein E2C01_018930 [Portunus trituberculatus]|uniref:Uncharacterized protein n=1 Tax=Portunus trituberculatus TaxID=210409 RepID=A0A5B7DXP2_PORTR|nr:hypothetical protein [Portunus trituberculatus]
MPSTFFQVDVAIFRCCHYSLAPLGSLVAVLVLVVVVVVVEEVAQSRDLRVCVQSFSGALPVSSLSGVECWCVETTVTLQYLRGPGYFTYQFLVKKHSCFAVW